MNSLIITRFLSMISFQLGQLEERMREEIPRLRYQLCERAGKEITNNQSLTRCPGSLENPDAELDMKPVVLKRVVGIENFL
jgi:hypothetical protein